MPTNPKKIFSIIFFLTLRLIELETWIYVPSDMEELQFRKGNSTYWIDVIIGLNLNNNAKYTFCATKFIQFPNKDYANVSNCNIKELEFKTCGHVYSHVWHQIPSSWRLLFALKVKFDKNPMLHKKITLVLQLYQILLFWKTGVSLPDNIVLRPRVLFIYWNLQIYLPHLCWFNIQSILPPTGTDDKKGYLPMNVTTASVSNCRCISCYIAEI